MSWNKIVGNERVKRILQKAIVENRVAHSYLFTGIDGIGKDAFAIQMAKTLNCSNPRIGEFEYDSCDICKSCKMFDSLSHPNFEIIFPLPAGTGEESTTDKMSEAQLDEFKIQLQKKAANPFHRIRIKGASLIRVNAIRDIKKKLSLSQGSNGKRVVLISEAEKMNAESANAFLKTLEEPGENVMIFLTTSKPDYIIQTIKSRCQQIKFAPLQLNVIESKLIKEHNIDEKSAKLASSLSMGSYTRAVDSFDSNFIDMRNMIIDTLRCVLKKKNFRRELIDNIFEMTKKYDKEQIIILLQILALWLRDAEIIKSVYNNIINPDEKDTLEKFANAFGKSNFIQINDYIEESIYFIQRNVILQGVIFKLFIKIRLFLFAM